MCFTHIHSAELDLIKLRACGNNPQDSLLRQCKIKLDKCSSNMIDTFLLTRPTVLKMAHLYYMTSREHYETLTDLGMSKSKLSLSFSSILKLLLRILGRVKMY